MQQGFEQIEEQQLGLEQEQRLTARQVAYMRMLEMPVETLRERIEQELIDNPALEKTGSESEDDDMNGCSDEYEANADSAESFDSAESEELTGTAEDIMSSNAYADDYDYNYDNANERYYDDDENLGSVADNANNIQEEQFRDTLMAQLVEYELTDHQRELVEYLIGSLEDDGLLKKKLFVIADELEIYMGVHTDVDELKEALAVLQQFEPAGIGARSLQETLLLQIARRIEEHPENSAWKIVQRLVDQQWTMLTLNKWDIIRRRLKINEGEMRVIRRLLRTLTPSPGLSPGEVVTGRGAQREITPDFIVDIDENDVINVRLNESNIPDLCVSPQYESMANMPMPAGLQGNKVAMQKYREQQMYTRNKVGQAINFMFVVNNRRSTMLLVMKEVAAMNRDFLRTGDETQLAQLSMTQIADATGVDLSIVSRVANSKWVETPHGMFALRWFFRTNGGVTSEDGEALSQDKIKYVLADIIAAEDKRKPLSDDVLSKVLNEKGYPVARRTVSKYREMLGIPVARLRQER